MTDKKHDHSWGEFVENQEQINKIRTDSFVKETNNFREGISARREKFIKDLNTGSPKVMPANKRDNY